jgi:hypothetical protein
MKTLTQYLAALCCCVSAHAAQQIVVPGGLANTEGNSSSSDLFKTEPSNFLQVYSAFDFASLGAPTGIISGISFRLDGANPQLAGGVWRISVVLFTTPRNPDGLSPNYSENGGTDGILVFGGLHGIVARPSPGDGPQPFQIHIPFTTDFAYVPAMGNLGVSIISSLNSGGTTPMSLDAQLASGDPVGRVFGDPFSNSGIVDTLGLITRFDITPVPEPSRFTVLVLAIALIVIAARINTKFLKSR